MVYYTIPSLFALWLTIDAVGPSKDDNDDDSNGIINHEEYEEEEDGMLVKDEPTSSRLPSAPAQKAPVTDDQTHLDDVDDANHELHAADRAGALGALAQLEPKFACGFTSTR